MPSESLCSFVASFEEYSFSAIDALQAWLSSSAVHTTHAGAEGVGSQHAEVQCSIITTTLNSMRGMTTAE